MKSQFMAKGFDSHHYQFDIAQQSIISCPATSPLHFAEQLTQPLPSLEPFVPSATTELSSHNVAEEKLHLEGEEKAEKEVIKKARNRRLMVIFIIVGFGLAAYFIWRTPATNTSAATIVSQSVVTTNPNKASISSLTTNNTSNVNIEVYITGAVQHPGVYNLSSDARVYQLLQLAGGPLPDANLVVLNLAGKLVDGQEIYVRKVGEISPITNSANTTNNSTSNNTNQGQLVNINSASETELRQNLHLSSKSALAIINYRQQHGPFTSIDELLQVISQTIYNKIKNQVTI